MPDETLHVKKQKFLAVYVETCNITRAAQAAGLSRQAHYEWLMHDPDYPAQFAKAQEQAVDAMESIAWDRAQTTSDTLMIFLLKGARPDKYRERSHQQLDANVAVDMSIEQRMAAGRNRARPTSE